MPQKTIVVKPGFNKTFKNRILCKCSTSKYHENKNNYHYPGNRTAHRSTHAKYRPGTFFVFMGHFQNVEISNDGRYRIDGIPIGLPCWPPKQG